MNFIETYKEGQQGVNKGLPMGEGLLEVSRAINGVQKSRIYGVAAAPKAGKSTLADCGFVIEPIEYCIANNIDIEYLYYSYEIDRISKEFDFAAHYLNKDHGITHVSLDEGITREGESEIEISSGYLMGRLQDDDGNQIKVKESIEKVLKKVYEDRIIPLFGEYDSLGRKVNKGKIRFIENRNNPTGIYKDIMSYAAENGEFIHDEYKTSDGKSGKRIVGYKPKNPNKYVIIIIDHLRKILLERGFTLKQAVDKTIEYSVELRNLCGFSFLHIIHLNRNMTDTNRIKYSGDLLYPNSDDIKDSGNLSEEADFMFTMFNPNDERYKLRKHFGLDIKDANGNEFYPRMRTLHLVENRYGDSPLHFRVNMQGNIKNFEKLEI